MIGGHAEPSHDQDPVDNSIPKASEPPVNPDTQLKDTRLSPEERSRATTKARLNRRPMLPSSDASPPYFTSFPRLSFPSPSECDLLSRDVSVEEKRLRRTLEQGKIPSEPRVKPPKRAFSEAIGLTPSKRPTQSDGHMKSLEKMSSQPFLQTKFRGSPFTYPDDRSLGLDDAPRPAELLKGPQPYHYLRVSMPPVEAPRRGHAWFTPRKTPTPQPTSLSEDEEEDERRVGTASLPTGRFLPGPIRRGSSQMATLGSDDDTGSPPSELDEYGRSLPTRSSDSFGSLGVESIVLPATSGYYDDLAGSPTAGSHSPQSTKARSQDTEPQRILSPARMLGLVTMLGNDDSAVSTNPPNHTSPAELSSPNDPQPIDPPSPADPMISSSGVLSNLPSDSIMFPDRVETGSTLSVFDQRKHLGYRPRMASGNLDSNLSMKYSHSAFPPSSQSTTSMGMKSTFGTEPTQPLSGLPPPPRPRHRITSPKSTKSQGYHESIRPLLPPPPPIKTTSTLASSWLTSVHSSPRPSPKSPPFPLGNDPPTRSMRKKPSFLEIGDDTDADTRAGVQVVAVGDAHRWNTSTSSIDDSFLDLGRENNSFDSIRTLSAEGPS